MPLIDVSQLSYRYPDGTLALDDVSFSLQAGECLGLAGPNGAGKSTLLWHLNGLLPGGAAAAERPRGGAGQGRAGEAPVRVNGTAVTAPHLTDIRRAVGLVFQDPDDQLFCPTVGDDVAFGPLNLGLDRAAVLDRVHTALSAVGLEGYENRLPHHLSLGERKRVCLAGVLACRPQILALDEPTANLDPRARRQLIQLLPTLDCSLVVASHDLEMMLEICPRVLLLDEGRIHADGPTAQVLSDEALVAAHGLELPLSLQWKGTV